jgi:hypothetical protein
MSTSLYRLICLENQIDILFYHKKYDDRIASIMPEGILMMLKLSLKITGASSKTAFPKKQPSRQRIWQQGLKQTPSQMP